MAGVGGAGAVIYWGNVKCSWGGRGLFDVNLDNLNGNVFISYALVFLLLDVIVSAAICKVFGQE